MTDENASTPPRLEETIAQARAFLQSPQVQDHDLATKRKFLLDKGLPPQEADRLLVETVSTPLLLSRRYA